MGRLLLLVVAVVVVRRRRHRGEGDLWQRAAAEADRVGRSTS